MATSSSGTVINFDEVRHTVVKVIKRGVTYELRDDIPMEVMVRGFALKSVGERMQAAGSSGGEDAQAEVAAAFDEASEETIPVVGDLFRWSYPDFTDDEVATFFSMEERMQLIQVFFQRRLAQLQVQPDATSTDMASVEALAAALPAQAGPNRATRRALPSSRRATTPRPTR